MKKTCALVCLLSIAAFGCSGGSSGNHLGFTSESLIGATTDSGDPAIVLFDVTGPLGGDCTAEFISTTTLVTAAHCVLDEKSKPLSGVQYRIYMGNDFSQVKDSDSIYIQPSNVHYNPAYDGTKNDSAVLVLDKPMNVKPLAFNTQPLPQSYVGKSARLIGYGATVQGTAAGGPNDGFGLKREMTAAIDGVSTNFVHIGKTGGQACDGDSGGPALFSVNGIDTLIGLDSYSNGSVNCTGGDYYERVDTQIAFIMQYMTTPTSTGGDTGGDTGTGSGGTGGGSGGSASSGAGTSTGATGGSDPHGGDPGNGGVNAQASATSGGCALARSHGGASDAAPWAAALALVALRRRRRSAA